MPVFREFWGWAVFAVLAIASLLLAVFDTEWNGFRSFTIAVGHKVQPLWVSSAILAYTGAEGYDMLAKAFDRKLRAKYRAKYRAEGRAEGKAEGKAMYRAERQAEFLSAFRQALVRRGMSAEDAQGVIDEVREVLRNEEAAGQSAA